MFSQFTFNKRSYLIGIASLIIGVLLVAVPYDNLINMIFTLIGIIIIILNVFPAIVYWLSYKQDKKLLPFAISATASIIIGFILIFFHHWILCLIVAALLIAFPIARILTSDNKIVRLKKELPLFVIAALLLFTPAHGILNVVFKVFGALLIAYAVYEFIYTFIYNKNHENDGFDNDMNNGFGFDDSTIINEPKKDDDNIIDAEFKDVE